MFVSELWHREGPDNKVRTGYLSWWLPPDEAGNNCFMRRRAERPVRPHLGRLQELDLALFRKVAESHSPFLDRWMPRLTHAADNSRLWMVLAGGLYLSGRASARRAALRGLLSLAATSATVNLPIKLIYKRTRPDIDIVPVVRRMRRLPVTTSFPSGHSASAFAFTTGVAMELPAVGVPLYGLASAVAASRVYTGAHYPGDCLAGAAIGSAIAAGSTRRWPVRPALGSTAPKVSLPTDAQASPEGEGLAIIVNSASGSALNGDPSSALKEALPRAHITDIDMSSADELRAELERLGESANVIGIAGGDGSVNTATEVALKLQKPLVVVPAGTLNHLSQAIGIETVDDAISAVRSGEALGVDVATIAGRAFLNTASFGSYVELVDMREKLEDRIGKWPALIVALIRVLRHSEPVRVEIDGQTCNVWMAFIGNCAYKPSGFAPSWRERLDDGKIDLRYVDATKPWARLRLAAALLTGRLGRSKVYRQALVERLEIRSLDGPLRLARDGETFEGPEKIVIAKHEKRLAVYAPHSKEP